MIDLLPLALLLVGAGLVAGLPLLPALAPHRPKLRWGAAALIALSGLVTLFVPAGDPAFWQIAAWSDLKILIPALALQSNSAGRVLVLALDALILAAVLNSEPETTVTPWALLLLVLAAGHLALLPANLLSLTLGWALLDLVVVGCWYVIASEKEEQANLREAALLQFGVGAASTLLLWCASLPLQHDFAFQQIATLQLQPGWMGMPLMLAALLRLAPFPFHLGRLRLIAPSSRHTVLVLALQWVPLAAGGWLLTQIPNWTPLSSLWQQILSALLLTGLVASGLLAWLPSEGRRAARWLVIGQAGLTGLAALWAGSSAALAEGMALLLAGGLLTLFARRSATDLENRMAAGLGIAALAGLPLTWSAGGRLALYQTWLDSGWGLYLFLAAGACLLLLGAALSLLLRPAVGETPITQRVLAGVGLGLPALGLLLHGFSLPTAGILAWIALLIPAIGGVLLALGADSLRPLQQDLEAVLQPVLALDWSRRLTGRVGHLAGRGSHAIHQVLEGEGALLWLLIIVALGWLLVTSG